MSTPYDRYERSSRRPGANSRRGTLTYWLPLALTVTVATVGIVAWIWSERRDDDEDQGGPEHINDHVSEAHGRNADGSVRTGPPSYADLRQGEAAYGTTQVPGEESASYMARMSGALRRTPSPQQIFDGVSRSAVAGVAAAGAVVGNALQSIRERDEHAYQDHQTWSEEAEARRPGAGPEPIDRTAPTQAGVLSSQRAPTNSGSGKRKTVAVVVSADAAGLGGMDEDEGYHHEHASILSHLPHNTDFSKIRLFVLIYAPGLKEHPLDVPASRTPGSLGSSFENIGFEQARTPTPEDYEKPIKSSASPAFNAVYAEALGLVEKETMVLPFTSSTGHVHILRHLAPDTVYLQESLAGADGDVITHLQSWLRQDVVLVVGADGGHGGLADSESEAEQAPKEHHWWEREERVGRGRGVIVVEGLRVGDDWARRVENRE
ncbi:peroxin 22-like protein [Phlyctema vagabunda]|uniref:Peroxin 22-like protein n=1 Tax=Phlyctema vagabunda TaxID=108571 RepID=A0ABR4PLE9_9HELO